MTEKWDRRFLELAKHISTWSRDPSTQVGSVVTQDKRVVGLGYNGFPRGVLDLKERYENRELKYKFVVHSEENSLIMAGRLAKGATLYVYPAFVTPPICVKCAGTAIQYGIKEIVGYEADETTEVAKRWKESIELSKVILREAGVTWRTIKLGS